MMQYKFNGKLEQQGNPDYSGELDQETGLYYYGARYYDPQISMWYGVDPKADEPTLTLNFEPFKKQFSNEK
jgi:RHS repeat-associated protein